MKYIFIHHSAIEQNGIPQFFLINSIHKTRWNYKSSLGFYGGYTYLIEETGKVHQYRKESEETISQKGYNFDSVSICLAGNFEIDKPTQKQKESLKKLLNQLQRRYSGAMIRLHNEVANTLCPGKTLIKHMAARNKPTLYSIAQGIKEVSKKVALLSIIINLFKRR